VVRRVTSASSVSFADGREVCRYRHVICGVASKSRVCQNCQAFFRPRSGHAAGDGQGRDRAIGCQLVTRPSPLFPAGPSPGIFTPDDAWARPPPRSAHAGCTCRHCFDLVADGSKTIEVRVRCPNVRNLAVGDRPEKPRSARSYRRHDGCHGTASHAFATCRIPRFVRRREKQATSLM